MEKSYLRSARSDLKSKLILDRSQRVGDRFYPVCGLCAKPITTGADLHEALITRGDISGADHLKELVHVRENCVLLHPGGCHSKAATRQGQKQVALMLITWEGLNNILDWLLTLDDLMTGSQAEHAKLLLMEVYNDG